MKRNLSQRLESLWSGRAFCSKGYSLVEIMISIILMGILGMMAYSTVNNWSLDRRLSRACQIMVSGFEYTASLSSRYQRPFEFTISTMDNSFKIVDTAPYPNPAPPEQQNNEPPVNADSVVQDPFTKQWYEIDFDIIPDLGNVTLLSGPMVLSFDADGNAPLSDNSYVMNAGGLSRTILVTGISGHISIQ